jgi:hypothetical protein
LPLALTIFEVTDLMIAQKKMNSSKVQMLTEKRPMARNKRPETRSQRPEAGSYGI